MQAAPDSNWLNSPLHILVFILLLLCAVSFLIGFVSGWFSLSRRFTKQSEPLGETRSAGPFFYGVCMRFWLSYNQVIRMTAAVDDLYLSVLFPFRIGHPPLCIPWTEIQFGRTKFLWRRYVVLTIGNQEHIPMRISERMARNLGILDLIPSESTSDGSLQMMRRIRP